MALYRPRRIVEIAQTDTGLAMTVQDDDGGTMSSDSASAASAAEVWTGILFFLACLAATEVIQTGATFEPPDGIAAFALFYVMALGIERLLEFLDRPLEAVLSGLGGRSTKPEAEQDRDSAIAGAAAGEEVNPAQKQKEVNDATKGRTAALAGIAAGLGVLAADALNADFLGAIGVRSVNSWLALVATGLVVAGGSKQLHDLITNVSKASTAKSTPAETEPAS